MPRVCLTGGFPPEPDTSDWDAVCKGPKIEPFFAALLRTCGQTEWSAAHITAETEDEEWRVQEGWYGSEAVHAAVKVSTCRESSDVAVRCSWRTHGLAGMAVRWDYALEKAGQLGHCAFRHRRMECEFATEADAQALTRVWRETLGTEPVFGPCASS